MSEAFWRRETGLMHHDRPHSDQPCDFCGSVACERDDSGLLLGCTDCGYDRPDDSVHISFALTMPEELDDQYYGDPNLWSKDPPDPHDGETPR